MTTKLPFGSKNNILVDVSMVERGLACQCTCPRCHGDLVARKGLIREHHFAHKDLTKCVGAYEAAIHLMTKQIIDEAGSLQLPALKIVVEKIGLGGELHRLEDIVTNAKLQQFSKVVLEPREDGTIADIIGYKNDRRLLVEVNVTHPVPAKKIRQIRAAQEAAIEIDLSQIPRLITKKALSKIVLSETRNKKWISLPSVVTRKAALQQQLEEKVRLAIEADQKKSAPQPFQPAKQSSLPAKKETKPTPHPTPTVNEPPKRWLKCDHCSHFWNAGYMAEPIDTSVACPGCTRPVSTEQFHSRSMNRFLEP